MNAKYVLAMVSLFSVISWAQTPYTIRRGDTLLNIADKVLGTTDKKDPRRYEFAKKIQDLNPELKNPNALEPGQIINLPGEASQAKPIPVRKVEVKLEEESPVAEPVQAESVQTHAPVESEALEVKTAPAQSPTHEEHSEVAAPAPAPAPAHEPEAHATHGAEHPNFLMVQPRFQTVKLKTKNLETLAKATMKSKSSFGLDLQYGLILNHDFHMLFQAGLTQTKFNNIDVGTVNHTSETLTSYAIGLAYEASSTVHMDLLAMYADRPFLIQGEEEYELEAVAIPGAELNISWDFYSGDSNIFGISAIGEYVAELKKHGIKYKAALEPLAALYWKSKYGHDAINYKVTFTYKHGHQKTSVSEQYEDLGILGVGVIF